MDSDAVKRILDARDAVTKFTDNRPGKFWMARFFKRHPELAMRTPQALGKERALVTREGMEKWFQDLKAYISDQDPEIFSSPDRIWNADESGFSLSTKAKKVVMEKGKKHAYQLTGNSKSQVTVLACHSASGKFLPPLVIYPYKRQQSENLLEGFPEAHFQLSDNGWITAPIFHTWLRDIFIPGMEGRKRPVLLLVDGHSSHSSMIETLTLCVENGIVLYCLKAHSSHLIQPLDQAFFGTIKPAREKYSRGFLFDSGENVGLRTFASVFKKAWDSTATVKIAQKGFSSSGIYPFNPCKVLSSEKLAPSLLFTDRNAELESTSSPTIAPSNIESRASSSAASNNQSTSAFSRQLSSMRDLANNMFLIGKEKCMEFIDCYEAGAINAHVEYDVFSNLLDGLFTPVCLPSVPSSTDHCLPLTTSSVSLPASESAMSIPSISSQPGCSSSTAELESSTSNPPSSSTTVNSVQAHSSTSTFSPQPSTSTSFMDALKLPLFKRSKTQSKQQKATMSMALSGEVYIGVLRRKEEEKEEAQRLKEQKKDMEDNRKKKAEEKEMLKRKREEAKELRKKNDEEEARKKRKRDEAALKKLLKEAEKKKRLNEEDSESESGGDEDVPFDDESEVDEEMPGVVDSRCGGCRSGVDGL